MLKRLAGVLAVGICVTAMAAAPTTVHAQVRAYDIRPGGLQSALDSWARRSGRQVIYRVDEVRGVQSPGARGPLSADAALDAILVSTGFAARTDPSGAVAIVRTGIGGAAQAGEVEAGSAAAEDESAEAELLVTGTRIRGAESPASPIHTLDREDFARAGAGSVQQVLRSMPQNFTGGVTETAGALASFRNGNDANLSLGAGVNLRGLGTESTLVLVNGRRMTLGGLGSFTDISAIPLSAVERVEVMPDGASAIYGSDAVGGVVNLILREDFEGAETRMRTAATPDGGLRQFSASQLVGARWSSGALLINGDYGRDEPLLASDRPYAIGLQSGTAFLTPESKRFGVLINGHQELASNIEVSALAYANFRDAGTRGFDALQQRQVTGDASTSQYGGTLELDWRLGGSWRLTLAQTVTSGDTKRISIVDATPVLPEQRTGTNAHHNASATELEAEGALIRVPAGDVRLAAGIERRGEELRVRRVGRAIPPSHFDRDVNAAYAELFAPLIGNANQAPFARRLDLTAAVRYEDYSDAGDATTYKLGGVWSPLDGLNVRGTYGTSFRAPYLYQYDSSASQGGVFGFPFFPIPVAFVNGLPDPDLGSETATTWTAGFDVAPDLFGVRISGTYFDIAYQDRIKAAPFSITILTDPSLSTLVSIPPDPEIMAALATVTTFVNLSGQPLSAVQATFDGRTRNQGRTEVNGLDLTVEAPFDTGFGRFTLGANASYLFSFRTALVEGAPLVDIVDTIFNPVDLRARAYAHWISGPWSASAFLNYVDSYNDNQIPTAPVEVSSWTTIDLGLAYRFGENHGWLSGLTLRTSVTNAFDQEPPGITERTTSFGNAGFDTENANPLGRVVSLEISKTW